MSRASKVSGHVMRVDNKLVIVMSYCGGKLSSGTCVGERVSESMSESVSEGLSQ